MEFASFQRLLLGVLMTGSVAVIAHPAEAYTRPSAPEVSQRSEILAQRRTRSRDRDYRDYDYRDRDYRDRDYRDRDFRDRDFRDYDSRGRDYGGRDFRELDNRNRRSPAPVPPLNWGGAPGGFGDSYPSFPGAAPPPLPSFPGAAPPPVPPFIP